MYKFFSVEFDPWKMRLLINDSKRFSQNFFCEIAIAKKQTTTHRNGCHALRLRQAKIQLQIEKEMKKAILLLRHRFEFVEIYLVFSGEYKKKVDFGESSVNEHWWKHWCYCSRAVWLAMIDTLKIWFFTFDGTALKRRPAIQLLWTMWSLKMNGMQVGQVESLILQIEMHRMNYIQVPILKMKPHRL